jgi:hypothetical protein
MRSAQKSYDNELKPIKFALDGAARALDLINNDKIKTNKQVRTLLAEEEAKLVTGKANYAEGTAERVAIDTFAGRAKDLMAKFTENPEDTISKENLGQVRAVYQELADTYMQSHDRMANTLLGGSDETQKKTIQGRAQAFQKQYGKRFGEWKGGGIGDAEGVKPPPVQLTAKQLEQARLLKEKIAATPAGPARDALVAKIRAGVSPEILQKVGLQ